MGIDNWPVHKREETAADLQGFGFENIRNKIADKLHGIAECVGRKAADQDEESEIAHYGKQASEWFNKSAEYVRQFDFKQADAGIRKCVTQSPGRSLLIAGAVGLLIGTLLRRR